MKRKEMDKREESEMKGEEFKSDQWEKEGGVLK